MLWVAIATIATIQLLVSLIYSDLYLSKTLDYAHCLGLSFHVTIMSIWGPGVA
jgi:hypothetical protein